MTPGVFTYLWFCSEQKGPEPKQINRALNNIKCTSMMIKVELEEGVDGWMGGWVVRIHPICIRLMKIHELVCSVCLS